MPDLTIPDAHGALLKAYLARPAVGDGPWPGVVVIHDVLGLTDVKEYPNVGHSFLDRFNVGPFGPLLKVSGLGYDHATAEDAWRRILRFFSDHLSSPD